MVVGGLFGIAHIEINEGRNVFALAQRIHSHGIVGRIEEQRSGLQAGQESAEAKEGFAKAMRIMLGSRIEDRKERQTGIGIGEQIQVIAEIPPITRRIPTGITVGLREKARAAAIKDALLPAVAGMVGAETRRGLNGGAITSDVKLVGMNRSPTNGFI